MWIPRTPEEISRWHAATRREARNSGLLIAGLVWLLLAAALAGGWIAGGRLMVVADQSVSRGSFWTRFPIFAAIGLPFAVWIFRREAKKELARSEAMTICPKCETASESNAGDSCACGGKFVFQSTVRWVDEEEAQPVTDVPK